MPQAPQLDFCYNIFDHNSLVCIIHSAVTKVLHRRSLGVSAGTNASSHTNEKQVWLIQATNYCHGMRSLAESRMQKYQLNLAEQTNSDAHSFNCNNHRTTQKKQKKHYIFITLPAQHTPICMSTTRLKRKEKKKKTGSWREIMWGQDNSKSCWHQLDMAKSSKYTHTHL